MWWSRALVLALALLACNGKDGKDGSGDTDEPPAPPIELFASAPAAAIDASLHADVVDAHRVVNTLMSSAALVAADTEVHNRLQVDNGAAPSPPVPRTHHCWDRPSPAQSQFTIHYDNDYASCEAAIGVTGGVYINDHPLGPVVFQFLPVTIGDRGVGGTLALDRRGAEPLSWGAYDSVHNAPSPDNRSPIGVTTAAGTSGVTFDGGVAISFFHSTWAIWGVASIQGLTGGITEVRIGGSNADLLVQPVSPGPSVVTSSLEYRSCRCPTGGLTAYDVDLGLDTVSVDLDDLKVEPDDFNDPRLSFEVDVAVSGTALVQLVGCGEYNVIFQADEPDAVTVDIPQAVVLARLQAACDSLQINDADHCAAMTKAVNELGDLSLTVSPDQIAVAAQRAVERQFDGGWCKY